jgi:hypothetical protein
MCNWNEHAPMQPPSSLQISSGFIPARAVRKILFFGIACAAMANAQDAQPPINVLAAVTSNYAATSGGTASNLGFVRNGMRLNEASLSLSGDWMHFGFHIDGGAGDFYPIAMFADTWKGPNEYLSQLYVTVRPFDDLPLSIDTGKFFTSAGAEAPQSYPDQNFNITRSLLFRYGTPLYHAGVRATLPLTSSFTVSAQLLSGTNTIAGSHGHQSIAFTAAWTRKKWSISQFYMGGNQKSEGSGWRQLSDTVVNLTPRSGIRGYAELLGGIEKRITPGYDRWFGWATGWKFSPFGKWSFSPRVERYNDPTGWTTGIAQRLAEFTMTAEFRPTKFTITRLEYRRDLSDRYQCSPQNALIAGVTLLYQRGL